jgi:hypothetical protein
MNSRAGYLPYGFFPIVWFLLFLVACEQNGRISLDRPGWLSRHVEVVALENGELPSGQFAFQYERDIDGRFAALRAQERLDEVIKGATTEFEQFLRLMDWTNSQWDVGVPDPYPPWNVLTILHDIRQGRTGGFCAQYAVVFAQSCLALGCQARYIDLVDLFGDGRRTHFTVEVWSNDYQKWVIMDPSYNVYYQRDGIPLNVLDLHLALWNNMWHDIQLVQGRSSRGLKVTDLKSMIEDYRYFALDLRNDHLSHPQRIWVRNGGGLDWSDRYDYYEVYSTAPIPVDPGYTAPKNSENREDFYWPVNATHMTLTMGVNPRDVVVELKTYTPNFRTFMVKRRNGEWVPTPEKFQWHVGPGINDIEVKAVNHMGVAGSPARARVEVHGAAT